MIRPSPSWPSPPEALLDAIEVIHNHSGTPTVSGR
jgi:hypothetical protein